jgi:hypothetical protein
LRQDGLGTTATRPKKQPRLPALAAFVADLTLTCRLGKLMPPKCRRDDPTHMTIANALTLLRLCLIPLIVVMIEERRFD